jgi:tRNA nucleotidyltransferase (CCA-adding enzyme)
VERTIENYVRGLGLDAYLVGGAVRDELLGLESKDADFLVPGVDHAGLRAALAAHGRVEDLEVAGQLVGVRLHPRERELRALAPAGIEFAPPRVERSTGPGRHDFVIVADASIPVEEDMARRDFTVNAIARRLATGELVDPFDGEADLRRGVLRTVSPRSFEEDPLRLVRGLRLVSQLGLEPDEQTRAQMRGYAPAIRLVSGERIGGGLRADGQGELSKLLLGRQPARALRLARDTGVLVELLPEFGPALGFDQQSERQHLPLDEHIFAVVQAAADAGEWLAVRLAALLHDLGKPLDPGPREHAARGARIAGQVLRRLRYPTRLRRHVTAIVREHPFRIESDDPVAARRILREHGDELALDLAAHRQADLAGKAVGEDERAAAARFRRLLEQERSSPHRLGDLAVDGSDLLGLGYREGPEVGRTLEALLDGVVEDPSSNTREVLLERARELLS